MKRQPAVAGRFYDASPERLSSQVEEFSTSAEKVKAIGIMAPHAGLIYSGPVAGQVYSAIEPPGSFVLLGPNHTGLGARLAIMEAGEWEIPTGSVDIDSKLAKRIMADAPELSPDSEAHMMEHSLEVQLPFIVHNAPGAKIVPITIMGAPLEDLLELGRSLAKTIKDTLYPITISASSDMSHFLPDKEARKKDQMAIEKVLALDPEGLYEIVRSEDISMCGVLPTVVMLQAAIELGACEARLIHYTTSGEVSGDFGSVVGYAGVVVT
ncbi:MAG: AmmeMemoRadiSam system protein B [Thermodesulfovibrionales bacterium]|nr:AmmeMemoRadiSam system protein B [Thermodesulfovibrionales bacterium]